MSSEEIRNALIQVISGALQYTGEIEEALNLDAIGMNSINFIQIVVELEVQYGITFEDEELIKDQYPTLKEFEAFLIKKIG